jgi:hypothetical protein
MAAGSITLILKKDEMTTTTTTTTTPMKRKQPIRFMCLSQYFNPEQCFSQEEFTVNPNEEHVLLPMNNGKMLNKIIQDKNQIHINDQRPGNYLGFSISLKQSYMTAKVGKKTPLSLIERSEIFNIVPFFMEGSQYVLFLNNTTAAAAAATATATATTNTNTNTKY